MPGKPELSIVVTVLNEERTVDELYERTVAAVNGRPFELLFVDDGSTDHTFDALRRLHERDPRVHAIRFTRNFGQHPAMHAGFTRARGDILVTMDGDLQNQPEDIPKLVAAVEGGADVASGRRNARRDSWGRTLPSRMINGMLRRFTGVAISDFGCAFNAYRRRAVEPMLGSIGRQKFTKALVLSGGASVVEVDVAHAARQRPVALLAAPPDAARLHVLAGFWPQPIQWIGLADGRRLLARRDGARHLRRRLLDHRVELPGPALRRHADRLRPRHPGIHPRAHRRVPGQNPAAGRRQSPVHDRGGAMTQTSSRHRRRRLHPVELHPPPAREDAVRGRLARRAHVRGQRREPRRRHVARAAVVRAGRHPRRDARARRRRERRRDRQRRRGVARREVDSRRRLGVRAHERRGNADPARRDPRRAGRALHPHLVVRGLRDRRVARRWTKRIRSTRAALRGDEGGRRPARVLVLRHVRAADRDRAAVQQLRAAAASRRR